MHICQLVIPRLLGVSIQGSRFCTRRGPIHGRTNTCATKSTSPSRGVIQLGHLHYGRHGNSLDNELCYTVAPRHWKVYIAVIKEDNSKRSSVVIVNNSSANINGMLQSQATPGSWAAEGYEMTNKLMQTLRS